MIAKTTFSMAALTDLWMTKLFLLAEYVCDKTSFASGHDIHPQAASPIPSNNIAPIFPSTDIAPIRFSDEDRMVEGELFK